MTNDKFLGVCILVAAFVVAIALVYHAQKTSSVGRYQAHPANLSWRIDTVSGEIQPR